MKTNYITDSVATNFDRIANDVNLIARYQNDSRATPADALWCKVSVDLGKPIQLEIGGRFNGSYRYIGNLNVRIKNNFGLGLNNLLNIADIISSAFKAKKIRLINFQVPRIVNVGRIQDDYQVNIICPFFVDSRYLQFVDFLGSLTSLSSVLAAVIEAISLISSLASFSSIFASLDSQPGCISSVSGISIGFGSLDSQPELGSLIVEISGSSGSLGSFNIENLLVAPTIGFSNIVGSLSVATKLVGSTIEISGGLATLRDVTRKFISSTIGASGIIASLNVATELRSVITDILWTNGDIIFEDGDITWFVNASTVAIGVSTIFGSLNTNLEFVASTIIISDAFGSLNLLLELIGSAEGSSDSSAQLGFWVSIEGSAGEIFNVSGSLDSQPRCISSIDGTSNVSGKLDVVTELIGSTDGIFGVDGSLDLQPELISSTGGLSVVSGVVTVIAAFINLEGSVGGIFGVSGSLDSQPGCISSADGTSNVSGSLKIAIELQVSISAESEVIKSSTTITWKLPTSVSGPLWTADWRSIDNNENTAAGREFTYNVWEAPIEFIVPETECDKIKILSNLGWGSDILIRGHYYDGSWHTVGYVTVGEKTWYEISLGGLRTITKFKLDGKGHYEWCQLWEVQYREVIIVIAANLDVLTTLVGSANGISGAFSCLEFVRVILASSSSSSSNTFGSLNINTKLNGSVNAESNITGGIVEPMIFADRGDAAGYDKQVGDFTTNGSWQDLDLSSIVPAGASAVSMILSLEDNLVGSWIMFRKKGNSNFYNRALARTQVANINLDVDLMVFCDSNRVIQYNGFNTTFTGINLTVKGWFI